MLTDVNGKSVTDIKSLNALSKMLMGECLWCTRTILLALSLFVFGTLKPDGRKLAVCHIQVFGTFVSLSRSEKEARKNQRMAAASSVCCCSWQVRN